MKILIIKTGALGDVVRTSYFAKYIKQQHGHEIHWYANEFSKQILDGNESITKIHLNPESVAGIVWDIVYSLEDEYDLVKLASSLKAKKIIGLQVIGEMIRYDERTKIWNDMGIHSQYGLLRANQLKYENVDSHIEIFSKIFDVVNVQPNWKGVVPLKKIPDSGVNIGINPFAGKRWPNKSLPTIEAANFIRYLQQDQYVKNIYLFGDAGECGELNASVSSDKYKYMDTSLSIDDFYDWISRCDMVVTSDSLAVHLCSASGTPFVCFFGPTSATEIKDPLTPHVNVLSERPGYCSYDPKVEILGLDHRKIIEAYESLRQPMRNSP